MLTRNEQQKRATNEFQEALQDLLQSGADFQEIMEAVGQVCEDENLPEQAHAMFHFSQELRATGLSSLPEGRYE